jgi:hypothetical protein
MKHAIHQIIVAALAAAVAAAGQPAAGKADNPRRMPVRDVKIDYSTDAEAAFGRPVSISHDADAVYVVDAEAHEVRVFSKAGVFLRVLGRKGQGPGEFAAPADLDARDGRLYVADKFNDRIQILDGAGKYLGGFKVPYSPDQVCALDGGKIVVSHLPLGLRGAEPMLHCYSADGRLLWEGMMCHVSGDRTYDAFRNLLVMVRGGRNDLYVVRKSDENAIRRFDGSGMQLAPIGIPDAYPLKTITLPLQGPRKVLRAFCWDAAFDEGRIGLLATDYTDEGDIGPGRRVYLVDPDGRLGGLVELPSIVRRIDLDGDMINAVDDDNNLRIFRIEPR